MNQAPLPSPTTETIDATIITYIEGPSTSVETKSALQSIEDWVKILKADGRPELISVANELQTLKDLLAESKLKGKAIGKILVTLGDLTTQTASMAEKPIADRLAKLGYWLTTTGQAM